MSGMSENRNGCRRCDGPARRGVHFVVSDAGTGACLATYDVCQKCMEQHSSLIIPAEARRPGVSQLRVSYMSFGEQREGGAG